MASGSTVGAAVSAVVEAVTAATAAAAIAAECVVRDMWGVSDVWDESGPSVAKLVWADS